MPKESTTDKMATLNEAAQGRELRTLLNKIKELEDIAANTKKDADAKLSALGAKADALEATLNAIKNTPRFCPACGTKQPL